jgi:hypothetical protein
MTDRRSFDTRNPADMEEYRATIAKEIHALDALADNSDLKGLLRSVEQFRLIAAEDEGLFDDRWGDMLIMLDQVSMLGNMAAAAREMIEQRAPWFVGSHERLFEHDHYYPWSKSHFEGEEPEGSDDQLFK